MLNRTPCYALRGVSFRIRPQKRLMRSEDLGIHMSTVNADVVKFLWYDQYGYLASWDSKFVPFLCRMHVVETGRRLPRFRRTSDIVCLHVEAVRGSSQPEIHRKPLRLFFRSDPHILKTLLDLQSGRQCLNHRMYKSTDLHKEYRNLDHPR